ncbi:dihydrolipoyl dehydrogenase [Myxococcota bacterium]|nr:dihydrolipoyl dehydrogenase [Myxococcota bacterium]MBU1412966.1 dihydrolipoyl dehydrogenase [Myxococcota bacterium]MBU1511329.1 dihydrolipoyl dehydrogenase [Myxococcota bacterium]
MQTEHIHTLVLGGGPAGYAAGIRLGQLKVPAIVAEMDNVGGVCLNRGCIPSKTLISAARRYWDARHGAEFGVEGGEALTANLEKIVAYKNLVVKKLTGGIAQLLKLNGTRWLKGRAELTGPHAARVTQADGTVQEITFDFLLLAPGSVPVSIPAMPVDGVRILDSWHALDLTSLPKSLLVVGGGVIGLELGGFMATLGAQVTVVEAMEQCMPGTDPDLVKVVLRALKKRGVNVLTSARVIHMENAGDRVITRVATARGEQEFVSDLTLITVGRKPNLAGIGLAHAGLDPQARFLEVDAHLRTKVSHIFAAGDVTGAPLLAHRATKQAEIAAENIALLAVGDAAGHLAVYNGHAIPAVAYTDPEVACVGLSATTAREAGYEVVCGRFPFAACGRAMAGGHTDGYIEVVTDAKTDVILGVQMVGAEVSELIGQGVVAVELGLTARAVGGAVFAHPTLSESFMEAAKAVHGEAIHVAPGK